MEKLSLDALARELMKSATAAPAGRASRTVFGGHERVLRQTLMALTAGSSMSEHENPGEPPCTCWMVGYALLLTPSSGKGATATC
jgi:hypothetical protein